MVLGLGLGLVGGVGEAGGRKGLLLLVVLLLRRVVLYEWLLAAVGWRRVGFVGGLVGHWLFFFFAEETHCVMIIRNRGFFRYGLLIEKNGLDKDVLQRGKICSRIQVKWDSSLCHCNLIP